MTQFNTVLDIQEQFNKCSPAKSVEFVEAMERSKAVETLFLGLLKEDMDWCFKKEAPLFDLFGRVSWGEVGRPIFAARLWTFQQLYLVDEFSGQDEFIEAAMSLIDGNKPFSLGHFLVHNHSYLRGRDVIVKLSKKLKEVAVEKVEVLEAALRALPLGFSRYLVESLKDSRELHTKILLMAKVDLIKSFLSHSDSRLALEVYFNVGNFYKLTMKKRLVVLRVFLQEYPYRVSETLFRENISSSIKFFLGLIDCGDVQLYKGFCKLAPEKLMEQLYSRYDMNERPLIKAARSGNIEMIDLVVDCAPPDRGNRQFEVVGGETAVSQALSRGKLSAAKRVLERAPVETWKELVKIGVNKEGTPLTYVMCNRDKLEGDIWGFVELLFRRSSDSTFQDVMGDGDTHFFGVMLFNRWYEAALQLVTRVPEKALPKLLVEKGAGVSWKQFLSQDRMNKIYDESTSEGISHSGSMRYAIYTEIQILTRKQ